MRFERYAGEPKNVAKLHENALATLKPELLDDFSALYNFFSNGVVWEYSPDMNAITQVSVVITLLVL